jgi:hypothetical protein
MWRMDFELAIKLLFKQKQNRKKSGLHMLKTLLFFKQQYNSGRY